MFDEWFTWEGYDILDSFAIQLYDCICKKSFHIGTRYLQQGERFDVIAFDYDTGIMEFYKEGIEQFKLKWRMVPENEQKDQTTDKQVT